MNIFHFFLIFKKIVVGTILNAVGAWVRVAGKYNYWYCLLGQVDQFILRIFSEFFQKGLGQPFVLNAVPKLAANWFPDDQRTIATTIASVVNPIGMKIF